MGKDIAPTPKDKTSSSTTDAPSDSDDTKSPEEIRAHEMLALATSFHDYFKQASKRWEMIIYPAIMGLFIMTGVFFFLFFYIVNSVQEVVEESNIGTQMSQVAQNMAGLTDNIRIITVQMADMQKSMESIDAKMADIKYMRVMSKEIAQMNSNMHYMNQNMGQMRSDFSVLNRNVSKPMSMMNSFIPW